jgi:hypothetical protein
MAFYLHRNGFSAAATLFCLGAFIGATSAQSIPSSFGRQQAAKAAIKAPANPVLAAPGAPIAPGVLAGAAPAVPTYKWYFPTISGSPDASAIHAYFNGGATGVTLLDQVQYLYGFGGSTNTMSADLIGATTGFGLHVALGSSVTASTNTQSTSTSTGSSPSSNSTTTETAIQQLENGGDFYVKGLLPMVDLGSHQRLIVAFEPKLGFSFQGFGSQNTITQATEENWNASVEGNYQYPLIPDVNSSPVSFYVDGKTGYQGVQGAFARQVGLGHQLNFEMSEVAAGFDFAGFRVGFQRFLGPTAAFGQQGTTNLATWHLAVQFSPKSKGQ